MIYEFRAWDEENKIMIYKDSNLSKDSIGYSEYYSNNPVNMLMNIFSDYSELVWELWTGKFDYEGNKIWQGDIIEICNNEKHVRTEIEWDDNSSGFIYKTSKNGWDFMESLDGYFSVVKVVGNIHEGVR